MADKRPDKDYYKQNADAQRDEGDKLVRKKLKSHYDWAVPGWKANNPEPDWNTKGAPDDDKIEISPLIRFNKGGSVKKMSKGGFISRGDGVTSRGKTKGRMI